MWRTKGFCGGLDGLNVEDFSPLKQIGDAQVEGDEGAGEARGCGEAQELGGRRCRLVLHLLLVQVGAGHGENTSPETLHLKAETRSPTPESRNLAHEGRNPEPAGHGQSFCFMTLVPKVE